MPYPNMPKEKWAMMDKCVADIKTKGNTTNPYAICFDSIMGVKKGINRMMPKKSKPKYKILSRKQ